jgi:hypothetical protein
MFKQRILVLCILCIPSCVLAVDKPRHIFVISHYCGETLGSRVLAALRDEVRASHGYQLATSLTDDGGYDVVITLSVVCNENTLPTSEKVVSIAAILGTGTCTAGNCSIVPDATTLLSVLCSGNKGAECGKDIYSYLDGYFSGEGGRGFEALSDARKKAMSN